MQNIFRKTQPSLETPSLQSSKASLDRALLSYMASSEMSTAGKMPGIFNNYDVLRVQAHEFHALNDLRKEISAQKDKNGLLTIVARVLNSDMDSVLKFCLAVGVAQEVGVPIVPTIHDKTYEELQHLTERFHKLVDRVSNELGQQEPVKKAMLGK